MVSLVLQREIVADALPLLKLTYLQVEYFRLKSGCFQVV